MATKKTVDLVKEDLRVLHNEVSDGVSATGNWFTTEFWTMAAGAVTNLVAVAVLIGWVDRLQADALVQALTAVVGATQVIVVNSALVWKYIAAKASVQAKMVDAQYRYLEVVTVERMRIPNGR